jgi:TolA-binding protein
LEDGASELELTLLQAGDADMPSVQARQAALAALGLSSALLSAAPPAVAAGSAATSSGVRLLAAKWWIMGALVTATGAAGLGYVASREAPAPPARVSHVAERSPAPVIAEPPAVVQPARDSSERPAAVPSARERPLSPAPASPRSSSSAGSSGIQEQIALIDRARGAVAAHQPAAALAALDEYQRRYPGGVLVQEAALLRIESLLARGDKATAARLGRQFLQHYPRSPMAARVKTLIDG